MCAGTAFTRMKRWAEVQCSRQGAGLWVWVLFAGRFQAANDTSNGWHVHQAEAVREGSEWAVPAAVCAVA
jgi:hypothetical protein